MCRYEVEKLLTELYQSNFRAQIEIFEMEVQLEWKSKKYPVQVQGKSYSLVDFDVRFGCLQTRSMRPRTQQTVRNGFPAV
jgi:hypothetical protein